MSDPNYSILYHQSAAWIKKVNITTKDSTIEKIIGHGGRFNYTIIEGPSIKWRDKIPDDKVYYMGITKENGETSEGYLSAFPIELQKAMMDYVLQNIKYPGELYRKIEIFQSIIDKHKKRLETKETILPQPQNDKLACFKEVTLTMFFGGKNDA